MYLLDTSAFIWFLDGDVRLSNVALRTIEDVDNSLYVSIATFWEIAIKRSIKKLDFTPSFQSNNCTMMWKL